MATIIPAGIKFKYVKISAGASVIDVTMDDARFYKNKPDGYYRAFIFPKADFAGNEYDDLKELVSIESLNMWDRVNRDTFLGYNEETNTFICNICAYMGLKDSDLKTDGEMPHAGMAGLYEMELATVPSGAIMTLKQTDGTNVYLKMKAHIYYGSKSSGNICVESIKKSVAGVPIVFRKEGALWCKSIEDGSALMVYNNIPNDRIGGGTVQYGFYNNRVISFKKQDPSSTSICNRQAFKFGKPIIYFAGSTTDQLATVNGTTNVRVQNYTQKDHNEYTETSDLTDIVPAGQTIEFIGSTYQNDLSLSKNAKSISQYEQYGKVIYGQYDDQSYVETKFNCYLKSCESLLHPFVFNPIKGTLFCGSDPNEGNEFGLDFSRFKENLPDGFIAIFSNQHNHYRVKKDDVTKLWVNNRGVYVAVTDTLNYPGELYEESFKNKLFKSIVSKNDLINSVGFNTYTGGNKIRNTSIYDFIIVITNTNTA